jgi:hypothetical protein
MTRSPDDHVYRSPALARIPWLEHGFGTRRPETWSSDPALVTLNQIHSDICVYAEGRAGTIGEGDALYTGRPGLLLAVRTADCLPILIADEAREAVAVVHAGWRGASSRIAAKAVAAMRARLASRPEDLLVAIGPGIGVCCYEVGPEVASLFRDLFPERGDLAGGSRIDLAEANRRILMEAGVPAGRIHTAGLCTACTPAEFHSWRRDGEKAGRMLSAIRILV